MPDIPVATRAYRYNLSRASKAVPRTRPSRDGGAHSRGLADTNYRHPYGHLERLYPFRRCGCLWCKSTTDRCGPHGCGPRFWARGALVVKAQAPLTGGALGRRAPPAGGRGAECPRFWAGGFGRPSGGAPYRRRLRRRRASPCPSLHFSQASQRRASTRPDLVSRAYSVRIARI